MSKWQAISIRPSDGQMCVVFDPENENLKVWPAQFSEEHNCFFSGSHGLAGWFEYSEVTHWMELPEPPNGN